MSSLTCIDGNEAAALVAYAASELIAVYPITPASPMGEHADTWAAQGRPNLWGAVPEVVEMQSEAGAAGALHGALQAGTLATTFTASQGLLLMLPNMFKVAGELTPAVIHVAARAIATHALSIFGDHSDVMAARSTGWAMLCASSVQEAHDFAAVAHAATLRTRVPFLHFFDGFRTSHEVNTISTLDDDDLRALIDGDGVAAHRLRRLDPNRPVVRGTAQNPDVFFQGREAANRYHDAVPAAVTEVFAELERLTGRRYGLVEYTGHPEAERVIVMMGSGAGAAAECVDALVARGERIGLVTLRLYRPFPAAELLAALPPSVRRLAVLDRCKEPGATAEPLYHDVVTTLFESGRQIEAIGGRYGLGSKEFTPAMARSVFSELDADAPKRRFTVGIVDDVTHLSLAVDEAFTEEVAAGRPGHSAVFYALGSDGTVGANKNSVKILGTQPGTHAQGYFVYDSKKSGSMTVSHLRFGPEPIRATYLIGQADLVACHQFNLLERFDVVAAAKPGATLLLNAPYPADAVWAQLPQNVRDGIRARDLRVFTIDAARIARELGMPGRINTVMQPCFFALAEAMDQDQAIAAIKASISATYGRRGERVVERNHAAVDRALVELAPVVIPAADPDDAAATAPADAFGRGSEFVARVTAAIAAGQGDLLPVSALPVDGTYPTATTQFEKRRLAASIPVWEPDLCIDCGKCAIVCPHAAIRMKAYQEPALAGAPDGFLSKPFRSRELPDHLLTVQVAPDDCTGCGVCVDVCPAKDRTEPKRKAINMTAAVTAAEVERPRWDFFADIPDIDPALIGQDNVKMSQLRRPLFEFSGACSGCGETPYLKLLSQLFGDRLVVANATGCSSIYGGNLPTTPWATNAEGRGPAWANSLFEDNAEFGYGLRLGAEYLQREARRLAAELAPRIGERLADELLGDATPTDAAIAVQRERVAELRRVLTTLDDPAARRLGLIADELVRTSTWIVGGDGWAYDIGYGGVDHVLGSGRNVNLLVLDTEVYSNTGGQASKATPRGAVAKFATSGKPTAKKDLGAIARRYGNVYVAQIAIGGSDIQAVKALREADEWDGPSLVIAYSTCIAHGIDMEHSMSHQRDAVKSGYWPLYRYHPTPQDHEHPFQLDSAAPSIPLREFAMSEARYAMLARSDPERSAALLDAAQDDLDERWHYYEQLAGLERALHPVALDLPHRAHANGESDAD